MRRLVAGISVCIALGIWQLVVDTDRADSRFLTPPSTVAPTLWRILTDGTLTPHIVATCERILVGFALSVPAGIVLGTLCAIYAPVMWALHPVVEAIRAIPPLALLPVFLLLFGIGFRFPVAMVVWVAWVPIFLNTISGIRGVDRKVVEAAAIDGASRPRIARSIQLPLAAPTILTGMRLAMGSSFLVITVAEMLGSTKGLGFYIYNASQTFHIPEMYAAIVVLAVLAFAANMVLELAERRLELEPPRRSVPRSAIPTGGWSGLTAGQGVTAQQVRSGTASFNANR